MKKTISVLSMIMAVVMLLSLTACGNKLKKGTYRLIETGGAGASYEDVKVYTTLEVEDDGDAVMITKIGEHTEEQKMTFDKDSDTVTTEDGEENTYKIDGKKIIIEGKGDDKLVFEKK